ncbi:S1 RNA-binding domain-containing transcriptional accessory protein [Geotalea daltonii FRC-32]|uniref:S1 RNA-binding domain-containing transcriptional accessory protein n=1 Tax=Geotalea daltonii (strain DSM 22248 / JCM 15807 / FRC-32) TaxID=316067 RepID=B9M315_GEODF|nr:Tex family protein [Geotalea daltonii]ACM21361.1 S1 RNA-binding domain-containing transcriptional accessory protein [Geotalea daltonii FRC-32]
MTLTDQQLTRILDVIVEETGLAAKQVANTVALLQEGATVPFIARYRKELTFELDEVQIRQIEDNLAYHSELEERKVTVLKTIGEQGKLTPELQTRIEQTRTKTELEDLYLPYKPKRRTKATIAKERGLEPLADIIAAQELTAGTPEEAAAPFVNPDKDVADAAAALEGAGHILAERLSEDADARSFVRRVSGEQGIFCSRVAPDKKETVSKFEMYYDYQEPLKTIPSHRMLAMRRGEKEEFLFLSIIAPVDEILAGLKSRLIKGDSIFRPLLEAIAEDAYRRLVAPSIEVELRLESKNRADEAAIAVFAENLKNLLLLPPAGNKRVLGVDPGLRTGSKLAAVDETGRFLGHCTIYPHTGSGNIEPAKRELLRMIHSHQSELVAIGNGTAGREMELFVRQTLTEAGLRLPVVVVNEAGASVYSASDIAREEFPELDLTVRGAISIARRLQDPLAELVKIDPKSIGVGQYQHDVNQNALKKSLDAVVESCVNFVGVDLNTASWALLSYVSGLNETQARAITSHRDQNGPFASRQTLLKVSRFGPKTFEQAAGFLRIRNGENPLDNTAVHPENYSLVSAMAQDLSTTVADMVKEPSIVGRIDLKRYVTDMVGLPTLRDIIEELKKPGRDPRAKFETATLRDDVTTIGDLQEGMILQGTVTNVAAFGAFVDIGVHQDGLVHVSHLSRRFVREASEAVKVGEIVKVKVLAVDLQRKRISLSIKEAEPGREKEKPASRPAAGKNTGAADLSGWEKAGFRVKK